MLCVLCVCCVCVCECERMSASRVKKVMNSNAAAVRVVVRVRPFLERENKERCVKADPSNNTLVLTEKLRNSFGKTTVNDFTYKYVLA